METNSLTWEEIREFTRELKERKVQSPDNRDLVFVRERQVRPRDPSVITISGSTDRVKDYIAWELRHPVHHEHYSFMNWGIVGVWESMDKTMLSVRLAKNNHAGD